LPEIEGVILVLHTLGFFAVLIPLVILAPKGSVQFVFQDFANQVGWSSNGLAWFVGIISTNLPFIGYDGPCHMAEEVQNASTGSVSSSTSMPRAVADSSFGLDFSRSTLSPTR